MKKYLHSHFDLAKFVEVFDELPLWSAPFGLKLLDFIDYKTGITALDIGFGAGFPLTEIALRLGDSSTVYGIDPWEAAIVRANKKLEFYELTNVKILTGYAESIPLADHSIDLITSNNGLNNVADMDKALSECSRIIKRGGQFVQTMNLDMTMFEFYNQFEQVLSEHFLYDEIDLMRQHIAQKRPSLDHTLSKIKSHGFIIKDLEQDQFNYKFANGSAMLNHYFIRLAFMDSWTKLLPSDKVEPIFDILEKRLNKQAQVLGGFKLSIPFALINAVKG